MLNKVVWFKHVQSLGLHNDPRAAITLAAGYYYTYMYMYVAIYDSV